MGMSKHPKELIVAAEHGSPSTTNSISRDDQDQTPTTSADRPSARQQHSAPASQPDTRILPPRRVKRGPSPPWPSDAPKLGSTTAGASRRPEEPSGTPHLGDGAADTGMTPYATPNTPKQGDGFVGTFLPAEPWGPVHGAEFAAAVGAALVFSPRCKAHVEYYRTLQHGGWEDWKRDAAVLRYLLSWPAERERFEVWFKSEPIAEDDRTTDERNAVWYAEHRFHDVLNRMRREDVRKWRGRVVALERDPRRFGHHGPGT